MTFRPCALVLALASACAGAQPAKPSWTWTFPEFFDATQVVSFRLDGNPMEFVASLRRRGGDYEVTLFDSVLGAPLLSAAVRSGALEVREVGPAGGHAYEARRLIDLLTDVYGRAYPAPRDGETGGSTVAYAIQLLQVEARSGCEFPASLEIAGPRGARVEVRTLEVECAPAAPSPRGVDPPP